MIVPVKVEADLGYGLSLGYCSAFDIAVGQPADFEPPYSKAARDARELAREEFVKKIKLREPSYVLLDKIAGKELKIEMKINGETWIYCERM